MSTPTAAPTPTAPGRRPPLGVLVAAGVVLVLLVGLGAWLVTRGPDDGLDGTPVGGWARSTDPIPVDTEVRVAGEQITLDPGGTDTVIDTGRPVERYVVAGDGVYFIPAGDGPTELLLATDEGVVPTGAQPQFDTVHASPDGRYLGFLETSRRPWVAVVVDLSTGEEVVRSTEGMGGHVSVEEQYEEFEPDLLGLTDDKAYVLTTDNVLTFALDSGDSEVLVADRSERFWEEPWFEELESTTRPATYVEPAVSGQPTTP